MALTAQEQVALTALQTEKVNTGAGYGRTDFWCVACVIDNLNQVVRQSACYPAGKSGGGATPSWFWGVKDANKFSCNDSECKVLNALESVGGGAINTAGNLLVVYSDHGPCGSCKKVIATFRKYYGIPVTIIYCQQVEKIVSNIWPKGTQYGWDDATKEGELWVRRF